ncbi:DUF2703 domain-containing protein [Clostridiales Family XIII bacterium ASD5510]|uniref:DUF2703 domain-containing protein n=1 Tax=Hominibacterium faecale TaxID=2839743 RepID=A0A9J6QTQ2_9FIRM|nr:DUF2703 domain-containing protein [Hominibacterium faecale]MCU7378940.1 DUF2703 domain-containing protein [Hominibacterium faecale]
MTSCERCQATDHTLTEAIKELYPVLETLGYEIFYRKIEIVTETMAKEYHFLSSPTIRINGRDICGEIKESVQRLQWDLR